MNPVHLALLFTLNTDGGVTGITTYTSLADPVTCRADIDRDARVATAHGVPSVGRCITINAATAYVNTQGMLKLYDCVGDASLGRFLCSGVTTVVGK